MSASALTRCPGCSTVFRITAEQLALREGQVRCGRCRAVFDANDHLVAEERVDVMPAAAEPETQSSHVPDVEAPVEARRAARAEVEREIVEVPKADESASDTSRVDAPSAATPDDVAAAEAPAQSAAAERAADSAATETPAESAHAETPIERAEAETPVEPAKAEPLVEPAKAEPLVEPAGAETPLEPAEAETPVETPLEPAGSETTTEPAPADTPTMHTPAVETPPVERPSRYEWKPRRPVRERPALLYAAAVVTLVVALALQLVLEYRDRLAAHAPFTRPILASACSLLGCTIAPLHDAAALSIDASDLQADPAHRGLLQLSATIRNRAAYAIAYPYLELTLTDASDQIVARRALAPREYVGGTADANAGIPGNGESIVRLFIDASATTQAGYRLYLFYP